MPWAQKYYSATQLSTYLKQNERNDKQENNIGDKEIKRIYLKMYVFYIYDLPIAPTAIYACWQRWFGFTISVHLQLEVFNCILIFFNQEQNGLSRTRLFCLTVNVEVNLNIISFRYKSSQWLNFMTYELIYLITDFIFGPTHFIAFLPKIDDETASFNNQISLSRIWFCCQI